MEVFHAQTNVAVQASGSVVMMDESLHIIAQVGILAGVFTSMLAVGANVGFDQILESLRDIRTVLLVLIANFVAVPLFALLLARLLPLDTSGQTALILLGAG